MKYTPLSFDVNLKDGFACDLNSLYAALTKLKDQRDARGLRYRLVTVLVFIVLAKLCGEDHLRGIAQWVRLRREVLADALKLAKPQAPHATTYSRVLKEAVDIKQFEQVVAQFFKAQPKAGRSVHICLDGKILRATIPAGRTHGVHLVAAYLPEEGWVLLQVDASRGELPAAMQIVKSIDLRGKIVTGEALFAQRHLSTWIVGLGGDYIWTVKDNQSQLYHDIETLFAPDERVPGFSQGRLDFRTVQKWNKTHGRLECRTLSASSMLKDFANWPHAEQVFRLERYCERVRDGKITVEVRYGVTSLAASEANADRLLQEVRTHWQIENGLHYRRDDTLHEDRCRLTGHGAHAMAVINNLVLGLLRRRGITDVPTARRTYAARLNEAVVLVLEAPA
jgi:predicted transposase YbfD/YdcC